jgi:hypothetical protein
MKDITKHIINAGLAGSLVLLGAVSTGNLDGQSMAIAAIAGTIVAITQFKQYIENLCLPKKLKSPVILGSII